MTRALGLTVAVLWLVIGLYLGLSGFANDSQPAQFNDFAPPQSAAPSLYP